MKTVEIYNATTLAAALGCSERTVRRAIKTGALKANQRNGIYIITSQNASAWWTGKPAGNVSALVR